MASSDHASSPASDEKSFRSSDVDAPAVLAKGTSAQDAVPTSVWTKLDLIVLPVCTIMYFLSSLDRSNIGNARVAGLQQYLHMDNTQYSIALTVTLIPYTLIEVPSNWLVKIVGPRTLLPTYVILWGLVCALQGVVKNYEGLLACRFFLGLFEGGLLPGLTLYLSSFYPRRKLQLRISILFSATSLASAFSGLLAAAILDLDGKGGHPGWAWLFIIEGVITIAFGLTAYFLMPGGPTAAPFFSAKEKALITAALREDGIADLKDQDEGYTLAQARRVFTQPHVLAIALMGFFNGSTLSGLSYFLPSIVVGLGWIGKQAQLMSVPPFATAAALSVATSFASDRFGARGLTIIIFGTIALIGFIVFYVSLENNVRYGMLFLLVPGTFCIGPPLGTWAANNSAPQIRRATSLAVLTTSTNLGAILSTWLLGAVAAPPRWTEASVTFIVFQAVLIVAAGANVAYLMRANAAKRAAAPADVPPHLIEDEHAQFKYVM